MRWRWTIVPLLSHSHLLLLNEWWTMQIDWRQRDTVHRKHSWVSRLIALAATSVLALQVPKWSLPLMWSVSTSSKEEGRRNCGRITRMDEISGRLRNEWLLSPSDIVSDYRVITERNPTEITQAIARQAFASQEQTPLNRERGRGNRTPLCSPITIIIVYPLWPMDRVTRWVKERKEGIVCPRLS